MNISVKTPSIIASGLTVDVDILGVLKAEIAELEAQADIIIADLKARGAGTYVGELFEANVADVAGNDVVTKEVTDPEAMEAKLNELEVPYQWFTAHKIDVVVKPARKDSVRLTVKARK